MTPAHNYPQVSQKRANLGTRHGLFKAELRRGASRISASKEKGPRDKTPRTCFRALNLLRPSCRTPDTFIRFLIYPGWWPEAPGFFRQPDSQHQDQHDQTSPDLRVGHGGGDQTCAHLARGRRRAKPFQGGAGRVGGARTAFRAVPSRAGWGKALLLRVWSREQLLNIGLDGRAPGEGRERGDQDNDL